MSNGSEHMNETIYLNGLAHERLDIERLTNLAFEYGVNAEFPEGGAAGWVTLKFHKERFCAWITAAKAATA